MACADWLYVQAVYATCLFCNAALGANEAIEHFPVGRRLAYDAAAGRLWVVCQSCARWNLSPLETRWEAIEEAERAFRGTKLRVAGENIGLAQTADGTELVRVGKPPRAEFAAWRYGDQFGRRYRKAWKAHGWSIGVGVAATACLGVSSVSSALPATIGQSAMMVGTVLNGGYTVVSALREWRQRHLVRATVRDEDGNLLRLTRPHACLATLVPTGHVFDWKLKVQRNIINPAGPIARALGLRERATDSEHHAILRGDAARRALAGLLPHVNSYGSSKRGVANAVAVINDAPNLEYLLHQAAVSTPEYQKQFHVDSGESTLGNLHPDLRLALEMSLHEYDERRAMEGELQELEARWRDADAIARIADGLLVPDGIDNRLAGLHAVREHQPTPGHDEHSRDSAG